MIVLDDTVSVWPGGAKRHPLRRPHRAAITRSRVPNCPPYPSLSACLEHDYGVLNCTCSVRSLLPLFCAVNVSLLLTRLTTCHCSVFLQSHPSLEASAIESLVRSASLDVSLFITHLTTLLTHEEINPSPLVRAETRRHGRRPEYAGWVQTKAILSISEPQRGSQKSPHCIVAKE